MIRKTHRSQGRPAGTGGHRPHDIAGASRRTHLSHLGGRIEVQGNRAYTEPLREVLSGLEDTPTDEFTHSFHTYPGRLHPVLVRRLLERFAHPGDTVLDPFVGGGTTLVETMVRGCRAIGTDINPIALRIARVRTLRWSSAPTGRFVETISEISEAAFVDARKRRSRPLTRVARRQAEWYSPHVLQELMNLAARVEAIKDEAIREVAWMVFSSLLVKISLQKSDTTRARVTKQIGRGTTSRLFARKGVELTEQLERFHRAVPEQTPDPTILWADARRLPGANESIDLIVTSPPYLGTYDYTSFQERRIEWLGGKTRAAFTREIGSRRQGSSREGDWREELHQVLAEVARVLKRDGDAFLVLGDGVQGDRCQFADHEIKDAASAVKLHVVGVASQPRPSSHPRVRRAFGRRPRREHLIHVRRWRPGRPR